MSAHADRGPSAGSSVRRAGSEDPHQRERKFIVNSQATHAAAFQWNTLVKLIDQFKINIIINNHNCYINIII